ncbi:MAG: hypothetical protein M0009_05670 [Deltaproteobacteria bacterium]|nr:hypothetical protein [Deltaproteobacteria bacterium]
MGVTGYLATETAQAPLAGAAGWTAQAPANYTFATAGAKTLYAWAKDAAGNVSASLSAAVTITLSDATAPTVTAFVIPATSSSLVVPVTTFTATDNVAVTGYLLTETAPSPSPGAAGWTATAPANYSFTTAGAKTLYAWAKDAAGNVSTSLNAAVTITLTDTTAPTVTAFVIPATSSSLTVPVTTFTATDNVAITGYQLTETAVAPAAGAAGWTATAPANHVFASEGAKTLYAWAKDAAGHVSASLSAAVTITLSALPAPTVVSPASGSVGVSLSPVLQIATVFPDPLGQAHKATDWQISRDGTFAAGTILFSSLNDAANLASITIPPGLLQASTLYTWRARTINSANQASPYSAGSTFTTMALAMDATGTVPAALTVRSGGVQVTNLSTLTPAQLAAAGNLSSQLVSGPNSVPVVNAGAGANPALPGMVIAKANGGAGSDVVGVVTPAGAVIQSVTTTNVADIAFKTTPPPWVNLPYGVISFRVGGIAPGTSVAVTVYTPTDLPAGAMWYKYTPARGWLKIDATGTYDSSNTLLSLNTYFTVVGGRGVLTIGDNDVADFSSEVVAGQAVVADPGAPAVLPDTPQGSDDSKGCFIATAAFGSSLEPHVLVLREFRDTFLMTNAAGRSLVDLYYRVSPEIAKRVAASESARMWVRLLLLPVIALSILSLKAGVTASLALTAVLVFVFWGLLWRRFGRRRVW